MIRSPLIAALFYSVLLRTRAGECRGCGDPFTYLTRDRYCAGCLVWFDEHPFDLLASIKLINPERTNAPTEVGAPM